MCISKQTIICMQVVYYYMVEETNNDGLHTTYVVSLVIVMHLAFIIMKGLQTFNMVGTTASGTLDSNVIGSQMARFHTVCKHHTLFPDSVSQVPRNVKFDG